MEALNGNIFYQMFCDIAIDPARPLTNYKLLDGIALEVAVKLKILEQQTLLDNDFKIIMTDRPNAILMKKFLDNLSKESIETHERNMSRLASMM